MIAMGGDGPPIWGNNALTGGESGELAVTSVGGGDNPACSSHSIIIHQAHSIWVTELERTCLTHST